MMNEYLTTTSPGLDELKLALSGWRLTITVEQKLLEIDGEY